MPLLVRIAQLTALFLAGLAFTACSTPSSSSSDSANRAVPVAQIDGELVVLGATEIARIRPSLVPLMEQRGLVLVTDLASADYLLTIRDETDAAMAEKSAVHIVSLSENRLRSMGAMGSSSMDDSVDASRSAASSFPDGIGTADPSRSR